MLGAGRERIDAAIDHAAGIILQKKVGDLVSAGDAVCVLEYHDDRQVAAAEQTIQQAYTIGDTPPAHTPLIKRVITA